MAKDKKVKKVRKDDQVVVDKPKAKKASGDKGKGKNKGVHPVEALSRLADHPLISELLAVGALAAVAAIAEAGSKDPQVAKSTDAVKKAGKAAATAIGARLLKEFSSGKAAVTKD